MQSINFEFLRQKPGWETLADLGGFAEKYARPEPVVAAIRLRSFAEILVGWIYDSLKLPKPFRASLNDLLASHAFQAVVQRVVLAKLHALRKEGNRAAHGETVDVQTSLWLLKEAFDLACWLQLTYARGKQADLPAYTEPAKDEGAELAGPARKAVIEKLAAQEAQMQKLLAELEEVR